MIVPDFLEVVTWSKSLQMWVLWKARYSNPISAWWHLQAEWPHGLALHLSHWGEKEQLWTSERSLWNLNHYHLLLRHFGLTLNDHLSSTTEQAYLEKVWNKKKTFCLWKIPRLQLQGWRVKLTRNTQILEKYVGGANPCERQWSQEQPTLQTRLPQLWGESIIFGVSANGTVWETNHGS